MRRDAFLTALALRIRAGSIGGTPVAGAMGLLQKSIAPLTSSVVNDTLRFSLAPHLGISNHAEDENNEMGDRLWSISS